MTMIHALVEGHLDGRLLKVLWSQIGRGEDPLRLRDAGGGVNFWALANRYNQASRHQDMIGLGDLEQAPCARALLATLKGGRSNGFKLRLAVRMLESWVIADRKAFASFMGVPLARIPASPDDEAHPKRLITALARLSTKRRVREALVPDHPGDLVGPEYTTSMAAFIESTWQVSRARHCSPSLDRACVRWCEV